MSSIVAVTQVIHYEKLMTKDVDKILSKKSDTKPD